MKLSDWADKQGIKYLTAYRWFKAGKMPVPCYQTESGTIIVHVPEKNMQDDQLSSQAVSQFLKKTVEFSNAKTSIEDFAAYVLSNYKLENSGAEESEVQKSAKGTKDMISPHSSQHFNKFLKKNDKKPELNMFLINEQSLETITLASADASSSEEALAKELSSVFDPEGSVKVGTVLPVNSNYRSFAKNNPNIKLMANDLGAAITQGKTSSTVKTLQSLESGAIIARSISSAPIDVSNVSQSASGCVFNDSISFGAPASSFASVSSGSYTPMNYLSLEEEVSEEDSVYSSFTKTASENIIENEKVTYDEARLLVDLMIKLNQVSNDPIQIDRKAKEICNWTKDTWKSIFAISVLAAKK